MRKMSLCFKLISVKEKPVSRYSKEMYKDIIREFMSNNYELAEVLIEVSNKSYVKRKLQRCVNEMGLDHRVLVSIVNNKCFLERY